jgi:hypothetical protein
MILIEFTLIICIIYIYNLNEKIKIMEQRIFDMNLYFNQKLIFNEYIFRQTLEHIINLQNPFNFYNNNNHNAELIGN